MVDFFFGFLILIQVGGIDRICNFNVGIFGIFGFCFFDFDEHIYNFSRFVVFCHIGSTEKQMNCLYIDKYITRTHKKKEKKRKKSK